MARGIPIVVAAPSGAGKTTVCRRLVEGDANLVFSVSHTTRPRRPGEREGVDYHFVPRAEFERLVAGGAFLESAEYSGNLYGTSWAAIEAPLRAGRDVLLEIEVQGARQVRARLSEAVLVFLIPLLIPRWPLPAIIGCLVLDAVDQTIFQAFGYDPPGYQSYDKAMDVFYLAIAYLATMRNWQNVAAYSVGRFLYFYRLAGVFLFEMTGARAVLLVFPNTFEYFFIAYEAIRTRWARTQRP